MSVACGRFGTVGFGGRDGRPGSPASDGHLLSRPPKEAPRSRPRRAPSRIGLDRGRDGVIYLPPGLTGPAPLFVLLHGATGSAAGITGRTGAFTLADELKMVILAPESRERTWDAIRGQFGPDVAFLDKALARVFETVPIDRDARGDRRLLGRRQLRHLTRPAERRPVHARRGVLARLLRGQPAPRRPLFYVSHGTRDQILPFDTTSRRIVPMLEEEPTTASASRSSTARTPWGSRSCAKRSSRLLGRTSNVPSAVLRR